MPRIRYMPKWLAFLIPITFSLAVLSAVGCSSEDDKSVPPPIVYSQETGIANIALSQGKLEPAYNDDVRNYGVSTFYTPTSSLAVAVTLKDPKSRLFIGGQERDSGQATTIALNPEGDTTIQISVQAEDGNNFNVVTLTTKQMRPNTTVYVYDSIGGNLLDGDVRLSLRDAYTGELLASDIAFPVEAQGAVFLGLDKTRRYNIYARRADTAMACFADFDPSREDTVTLYSRRDWVKTLPASAPIILDVAFGAANAMGVIEGVEEWVSVPPEKNYIEAIPTDLRYVKVTAIAESDVYAPSNLVSTLVNIDDIPTPSQERVVQAGYWEYANAHYLMDGKRYLMTDWCFSLVNVIGPGEHFLDIVVYDGANNRTERKIYLGVTDTLTTTDSDLSNASRYSWWYFRTYTYGVSFDLYSTGPVDPPIKPLAASYDSVVPDGDLVYVQYEIDCIPGFRGYELERATNPDGPFKVVRRRTYANPSTSSFVNGYDFSAELVGGVTYYYRMRFYNRNGYSPYSPIRAVTPMPSFNVSLALPANQSVSSTLRPTFKFNINDALLNRETSDFGRFTLFARDKNGGEAFRARFEIDYRALDDAGNPTIKINDIGANTWLFIDRKDVQGDTIYVDPFVYIEDNCTLVIDTDLANKNFGDAPPFQFVNFEPGVTYEWNVFGDNASANDGWGTNPAWAMYFYKVFTWAGAGASYSWSYASSMDEGLGAVNGYFTLIMHPDAE